MQFTPKAGETGLEPWLQRAQVRVIVEQLTGVTHKWVSNPRGKFLH